MKKIYIQPIVEATEVKSQSIICASITNGGDSTNINNGGQDITVD
jgi:hypothetical protein